MSVGGRLHLVHPLGFDLSEKALRRAGLDYWRKLDVVEHESWSGFCSSMKEHEDASAWLFTTHAADQPHWQAAFKPGDFLLFGSETKGAADEVHEWVRARHGDSHRVTLPQASEGRSINLSAAVSAGLYEAVRQCHSGPPANLLPNS